VFIAADMAMFGLLFFSFALDRLKQPALFEASRKTLNATFGGVNTLILVTSSWFLALGVEEARRGNLPQLLRHMAIAIACGMAFGCSKAIEYTEKLRAGISIFSNQFYMYYYALTGIHLLHVAAGTVVLGVLWRRAQTATAPASQQKVIEAGACYWHMVDLLWIVLFPLLYLMG
jgi:nitric oxide reductase NorE protein